MSLKTSTMSPTEAVVALNKVCATGDTREIAHFVVYYVEELKERKNIPAMDEFLAALDPAIHIQAASCVLRSSFSANAHLSNYMKFLADVRKAHSDNPRIDRILVGLNRIYEPMRFY